MILRPPRSTRTAPRLPYPTLFRSPGARVEYAPGASPDKRTYRVDCTKIARMLPGFRPQWTAPRGILELLEKYRTTGLTLEDFEGSRYQRLAHLQALLSRHQLDESLRWIEPAASAMLFPPHLAAPGSCDHAQHGMPILRRSRSGRYTRSRHDAAR